MTRPGRFAAAVALVAAAGAAGWWLISVQLAVGSLMADVTTVTVADDAFVPDAIVVPAGTTVTWRWRGQHGHDLVAEHFSASRQTEGVLAHRFGAPGRYRYACSLHAGMRGIVEVTP